MTAPLADDIVHQPHRLRIMAALDAEPGGAEPGGAEPGGVERGSGALDFARLKAISGATDGNLGAHLATLEGAGYVALAKEPAGRRTRTLVTLTPVGRRAFRGHVAYLRAIIDAASDVG